MDDVDVDTLAKGARRYTGLKRRYWQFFLGGLACMAVLWTVALAFGKHFSSVGVALYGVPLLGFLTCWVGFVYTQFSLMRFRCPRCGKRFMFNSKWHSWLSSSCEHCSLTLGIDPGRRLP
jgi:hypothetical protein